MNNEICYKYLLRHCPVFWRVSKEDAKILLQNKPCGSFILRPSDPDCSQSWLFAITCVEFRQIKEGHIIPMEVQYSGAHLININTIGIQHQNNVSCDEDILYGVNRNIPNNPSLKILAIKAFLENHTWNIVTDWNILHTQFQKIFNLWIPETLKEEIFGFFLSQFATFTCDGIFPELE